MNRPKKSGGLLLFDKSEKGGIEVLVAHPGGPFFRNKDDGWWSIPKGEPEEGEDIFDAALREFEEETGLTPQGPFFDLEIFCKEQKTSLRMGFRGSLAERKTPECNEITLEFPKGSGKSWTFPEIDRVLMLPPAEARAKLRDEQMPFVDRLLEILNVKQRLKILLRQVMRLMMTEFQLRKKSPYRTQLIFVGLILFIGVSRYIPCLIPSGSISLPFSPFSYVGAMLRGAWSWIAPIARSSLPICFSIRLMDPPSSSLSCSPPAFHTS